MTSEVRPFDPRETGAEAALEAGHVLWLRESFFAVELDERRLLTPSILAGANKNVSFDCSSNRVSGASATAESAERLRGMLARFSDGAEAFVRRACPAYAGRIRRGRTSFRPVEIAGRESSWRKDDTRLHVDSFPATPVQGRRILRVFANVNPEGRPRAWRVGEDFDGLAARFAPALRPPIPGAAMLLHALHLTKTRRSAYDALMLQLHDRMKEDSTYQAAAPQRAFDFPAGSAWMAFTDQVSHAAMTGQYQLEQTFLLPVDAMLDEQRSPLRILERLKRRPLV
jgi:3-deoxy-D-manno-octulosonic acid hydroxylase-like protein